MRVVYNIPRTPETPWSIVDDEKVSTFGDVDDGPDFGFEARVRFIDPVNAADAARIYGNYLARNYEDDFRQTVVEGDAVDITERTSGSWIVKVHLAWGDGHYTAVTA